MNKPFQLLIICLILYIAVCIVLYFFQEKLLFFPTRLSRDHVFSFNDFEEIDHRVDEDVLVNTVLFKSKEQKGVVFFLHGNGGAIDGWGQGASLYINNGYDVLYMDYRGYGKSDGVIKSEQQLVSDAQVVYDYLKKRYTEARMIVSGISIGTGIAAKIAALNHPQRLVLNSPYYSLKSLIKEKAPFVPGFLIKYRFELYKELEKVNCPVTIFHGNKDEVIPVKHSTDLKKKFEKVELHIIEGYGHNDLSAAEAYRSKLSALLK